MALSNDANRLLEAAKTFKEAPYLDTVRVRANLSAAAAEAAAKELCDAGHARCYSAPTGTLLYPSGALSYVD